MNPSWAACKRASRAAKRGDVRECDRIELAYIRANVSLYSRRADEVVPGVCERLCRGAGPNGETRLEWYLPNGKIVYSDMDACVAAEYEDDACAMLVGLHPGRVFELLEA